MERGEASRGGWGDGQGKASRGPIKDLRELKGRSMEARGGRGEEEMEGRNFRGASLERSSVSQGGLGNLNYP